MSDQVSSAKRAKKEHLQNDYQWCKSSLSLDTKGSFVWQIERFSERPQKKGESLTSSEYTLRDANNKLTKWKLQLYPKGNSTAESEGYVSLYLHNVTGYSIRASYVLAMLDNKNKRKQVVKDEFEESNKAWGYRKYISIETLKSEAATYLPNDTLTIVCDITIPGKEQTLSGCTFEPSTSLELKQRLNEDLSLYMANAHQDKSLADCKIVCQNEEFPCHTFVLASRSPVFHTMFTSDHVEAKERMVKIDNMEPRVMKELLQFIYTGDISDMSQDGTAEELLAAAEQYQLDILKEMCEDWICNNMSIDKAVDNLVLADFCRAQRLKKSTINFIVRNMESVVKTDSWKEKLFNHPQLMTDVFVAVKKNVETKED